MERERIHHQGSQPLNGNDAYTVLGIVFDWMEDQNGPLADQDMLLARLRQAGYCCCVTEYGCVACGGVKKPNKVKETFAEFGFDEFMTDQIVARLRQRGLIVE